MSVRKLAGMTHVAGGNPSASQREEIAEQDAFVNELRVLHEEVARIAPLWAPNLNDGVIINYSPLWRLVPQHRTWQKECRECWDTLAAGKIRLGSSGDAPMARTSGAQVRR